MPKQPGHRALFIQLFAVACASFTFAQVVTRMPISRVPHNASEPWAALGPDGGASVRAIAVDPNTPATIYAGTLISGIFKSTDGGEHWSAVNSGVPLASFALAPISALEVDPRNSSIVYAATGTISDPYVNGGTTAGSVLVSTNGGKEWNSFGQGLPPFAVGHSLAVDPIVSGTVYAGFSPSGIFKTTDAGATWSAVNSRLLSGTVNSLAIDPSASLTLYAGTSLGIAKTANGGESWSPMNTGLSKLDVQALAIAPSRPSTLYAAAQSSALGAGFFRSLDGGLTWTEAASPSSLAADTVVVDPTNPSVVYAATRTGISKSQDGGQSWIATPAGLPVGYPPNLTEPLSRIGVDPRDPSNVYFGAPDGVFKTANGGTTWKPAIDGLAGSKIVAVAPDPFVAGKIYAVIERNRVLAFSSSGQALATSTDYGATWTLSTFPYPVTLLALAADPNTRSTLYAAGDSFYRSTDGGANWTQLPPPVSGALFEAFAIPRGSPGVLYAVSQNRGVFKSVDGGTTLVAVNSGLPSSVSLSAIAIDPANPNTVYVGGVSGIFRSTDGGASWNLASKTIVRAIIAVPTSPTSIYAAAGFEVFRSLDGGASWSSAGVLPRTTIVSLAFDLTPPAALYAGTDIGIYRAEIARVLWTEVNTDLDNLLITSMGITEDSPKRLFAGTAGNGVFRLPLPSAGDHTVGVGFRKTD